MAFFQLKEKAFYSLGNGNPLQYACLENSMDRGAWQGYSPCGRRVGQGWVINACPCTSTVSSSTHRSSRLPLISIWKPVYSLITGSHCFPLHIIIVFCVKVKSLSRVRLFAIPWTVVYQASLSMGFSRHEYWSGLPLPSPGASSPPRDRTRVSRIAGRCFTICAKGGYQMALIPA